MNTVSGGRVGVLPAGGGQHRRLRRTGRLAAAARAAAAAPATTALLRRGRHGRLGAARHPLDLRQRVVDLDLQQLRPTSGDDFAWLIAAHAVVLVVVAGQAIGADVLRRHEEQLGRVEDIGVVADLGRRHAEELGGEGLLLAVRLGVVVVHPHRLGAPGHSVFSFSAAVRMPVRLPPDSPRNSTVVKPPALRLRPALTSSSTKRSSGKVIVPGLPMWPVGGSQLPSGT